MEIQRRLVLDANILIRAVLGRRAFDIISANADRVAFFAPDVAHADARRYLPGVLEKRLNDPGATSAALVVLDRLTALVHTVPEETYITARAQALARIGARDPDDWPVLATALVLDCPIWTEDQDFFGTGVPTWTTDRVELFLGKPD
jgi:predicted nucleic acid-binding protein